MSILILSSPIKGYCDEKNRIEVNLTYEQLSPKTVYGTWKNFDLMFYSKTLNQFTPFVGFSGFSRSKSGKAALETAGTYIDLSDCMYTYSQITAGSNSDYLPRFRLDHEFNIKLGKEKNIVFTIGASYIKYWDVHRDTVFHIGPTIYKGNLVFTYFFFRNISNPGGVTSNSHLVSLGYGEEGKSWIYLDISFGKQAYLATNLTNPEKVINNSYDINLTYRKWLGKDFGIILGLGYFRLIKDYKKFRISSGFFKEF